MIANTLNLGVCTPETQSSNSQASKEFDFIVKPIKTGLKEKS